ERADFTHIEDLVDGITLVLQKRAARNQVFNLTYGSSRSVQDLVGIVRQHFPQVEVQYVERDKLMPFRGTLSVGKARQLLGYEPKNPIEVGFPKYIDWYKQFWGKDR